MAMRRENPTLGETIDAIGVVTSGLSVVTQPTQWPLKRKLNAAVWAWDGFSAWLGCDPV